MNEQEHINYIKQLYELFYGRVSGYKSYEFRFTEQYKKMVDTFLKLIDNEYGLNSISYNFWFDYFSYAFQQRGEQKTRFGKGDVKFNWVIGKKQLEYWKQRDVEHYKYFSDLFCDKYDIKKQDVKQDKKQLQDYFEREKRRFYNTLEGLLNCMELGLNFDVKSMNCVMCNNRNNCK